MSKLRRLIPPKVPTNKVLRHGPGAIYAIIDHLVYDEDVERVDKILHFALQEYLTFLKSDRFLKCGENGNDGAPEANHT